MSYKEIKNSKEEGEDINIEFIRDGETKILNVTLTSSSINKLNIIK